MTAHQINKYYHWQTMHWEIHPTERPAYPQIPWFWVLEKEVYPKLIHINTTRDLVSDLKSISEESVQAMFEVRLAW